MTNTVFQTSTPSLLNTTTRSTSTAFPDIGGSCDSLFNSTGFMITDYEGIPENLLINIVAWFALIVVYTFLRKIGDYGRFGLIKTDEEKRLLTKPTTNVQYNVWTSSLFAGGLEREGELINSQETDSFHNQISPTSSNEIDNDNTSQNSEKPASNTSKDSIINVATSTTSLTQETCPYSKEYPETYIFSWFIYVFTLKDHHIKEKSGKDALYYIIFERYLIVYLLIVTGLSLGVLLPINILNGTAISSDKVFSKTTISNISPDSAVLWVHIALSWLYLVIGFIMVKVFSKRMDYDEGEYVSRTILVTNYPTKHCDMDLLKTHFSEAYPSLVITDIQFAYDINKLSKLHAKKHAMECGRTASQKIFDNTNVRPKMHPFHFGSVFEKCCCFCECCLKDGNKKETDSINFYTEKEADLKNKIEIYKDVVLKHPLGIFFVTFEDQFMAGKFLKDYHLGFIGGFLRRNFTDKGRCTDFYLCRNLAKSSSISTQIKSDMWSVKYATSPSNIIWENVHKYGLSWWLRVFLINIVLFILMIFFTTPSILISKLTSIDSVGNINNEIKKILPDYLAEFLPSLTLRLLAALLPVLVALTALAELHWTRSSRNRSMMIKTFTLLLFMTLILPILGLTSIDAVFAWFQDKTNFKWRCVSNNGAFFIKYVTTFGLIGTALDLLRLPDLLLYLVKMVWSRSSVERHGLRKEAAFEFNYGVEYAWVLTMFTVTMSFSVVCPLITPFGLLYMILKHMTDRYNLYFGYIPTKVDKRIHKTAVTFAIVAFIMLQFWVLFFIAVRNKGNINSNSMNTVQILVIVVSCILFFGHLFFGFFKRLSPFHKHSDSSCSPNRHDFDHNQTSTPNNEHYNELNEQDSVNDRQPTHVKKKHRNLFKKKKKKYELFQSPFVPSLLRGMSSDSPRNLTLNPLVKLVSVNSSVTSLKDPSELILNDPSVETISESEIGESEIDIRIDTPVTTAQPKSTSFSTNAITDMTNILRNDAEKTLLELGNENEGFHQEDHKY